jgi:diguanylate cyclase (GGDEF)-like protein
LFTPNVVARLFLLSLAGVVGAQDEVRVGYENFRPYLIADPANGQASGLAVDVIEEAARRANIRLRWIRIAGTADDAFRSGQIDVHPLLTITEERRRFLHFGQAWWENHLVLVSRARRPIVLAAETAGKRIAVRNLPQTETMARELLPQATLTTKARVEEVIEAFCRQEADAAFLDLRLVQAALNEKQLCGQEEVRLAWPPGAVFALGAAAVPSKAAQVDRLTAEVRRMTLDGTLSVLSARWGVLTPFETRHMREAREAVHRNRYLFSGIAAMLATYLVVFWHVRRMRRANRSLAEARQAAAHQALHDPLTGLPNRRLLDDRLNHAAARAHRENRLLAVLFIDLDGFKQVNDTLGHAAGDELLRQIAGRLQHTIRQTDTLARTGGDEFTLLVENVKDEASALNVAQKVGLAITSPFVVFGSPAAVTASIGVSLYPVHAVDGASLQQLADAAMYAAKRAGKNAVRLYQPTRGERAVH